MEDPATAPGHSRACVLARDGHVIGAAMSRVDGELAALVVTDDRRRDGVGTALVEAIADATSAATGTRQASVGADRPCRSAPVGA